MKTIYHIFIIGFVLIFLYFIRSDVQTAFTHAVLSVQNAVSPVPQAIPQQGSNISPATPQKSPQTKTSFVTPTKKAAVTPGPLKKVADNLLTTYASSSVLSIKGVIAYTNENRKTYGNLSALRENAKLDKSAQIKLQDMFTNQYFEHKSPSGVSVGDLAQQVSYEYIVIGENLALGNFKDDNSLVEAWMASPGHRANILNVRYTEIGVAVGRGMYQGHETWLAVQHFGLPRSACPSIDQVLRGTIEFNQNRLKDMETDLATRRSMIDSGAVYEGMSHNEQIDEYNKRVALYNDLIAVTKEQVARYNLEVKAFNSCIAGTA